MCTCGVSSFAIPCHTKNYPKRYDQNYTKAQFQKQLHFPCYNHTLKVNFGNTYFRPKNNSTKLQVFLTNTTFNLFCYTPCPVLMENYRLFLFQAVRIYWGLIPDSINLINKHLLIYSVGLPSNLIKG